MADLQIPSQNSDFKPYWRDDGSKQNGLSYDHLMLSLAPPNQVVLTNIGAPKGKQVKVERSNQLCFDENGSISDPLELSKCFKLRGKQVMECGGAGLDQNGSGFDPLELSLMMGFQDVQMDTLEIRQPQEEHKKMKMIDYERKSTSGSKLPFWLIENPFSLENEIGNSSSSSKTSKLRHGVPALAEPSQRKFLFEKEASPSDVGDYNRFLIPRHQAEKHFPSLRMAEDLFKQEKLKFTDHRNIIWEMKFEFWGKSQSYVLTTGWKMFVQYHHLQHRDKIRFYELYNGSDDKHYGIDYDRPNAIDMTAYRHNKEGFEVNERYHKNGGRRRIRKPSKKQKVPN